jgi:sulfofructose kinase
MGVITMDTIALVDKYPDSDERVIADSIIRAGGGPAAVAAVTLSRLGVAAAIVGTIGNDEDGQKVLEIFKSEGVDTSGINVINGSTSGSVIIASKSEGTRAIATRQPVVQAPINSAAKELASRSKWVHVDHVGIHRLAELGINRDSGPKISFDAGYDVKEFDVTKVDLFAPNDRQMSLRHPSLELSAAVEADAKTGGNIVVATMGSKGSIGYSSESGLVSAAAIKGEIVSTLGAGDVFHGALLASFIENRSLADSLFRANVVAALSCRGLDGQSAIPKTSELEGFIATL